MTEWNEFRGLDKEFDLMANRVVIDGRKLINPEKLSTKIDYEGICW
jgi:UDPglucose 6-dehydrogenase